MFSPPWERPSRPPASDTHRAPGSATGGVRDKFDADMLVALAPRHLVFLGPPGRRALRPVVRAGLRVANGVGQHLA